MPDVDDLHMRQLGQLVSSTVVVAAAVVLIAKVRSSSSLDIADAGVLVAGLVIFARALIRLAAEPGDQAARSR